MSSETTNHAEPSTPSSTTGGEKVEDVPEEQGAHTRYTTSQHECTALPQGWKRSVRQYQSGSMSIRGKYKTTAYVFKGERYTNKYQLARAFSKITKNENGVDLSSFDWKNGRWIRQHHKQKKGLEQLSTELFGKGITDINFTISQPTELLKRALPQESTVIHEQTNSCSKGSEVKSDVERPTDIPVWDFNYENDEGINGTPIHHPMKKRCKQSAAMSQFGPLQLYSAKRFESACSTPCYKTDEIICQPGLPIGMDTPVIPNGSEKTDEKPEKLKMEDIELIITPKDKKDFKNLSSEDMLWRQAILSLTLDGKALPSTAIWGQNEKMEKKIAEDPDVWVDAFQPLVRNFNISKEIIAQQAGKVRGLRKELSGLYKELDELERQKLDEQMREDGLIDDEKDQVSDEEKVNGTTEHGAAPPKQNGNQSTNEVMIID